MNAKTATLTATLSPVDRARALIARRGGRTSASTLSGAMSALRKLAPRQPAPAPLPRPAFAGVRVLSLVGAHEHLHRSTWQARARVDRIETRDLLDLAIAAHRDSGRHEIAGRSVPNSYQGRAETSIAWAQAIGRVVVLGFARVDARKASYGRGVTPASKAPARIAILRSDLARAAAQDDARALVARLAA